MYNDQKTKNEGQTICTMIRRQGTKDNMYNDQKTRNEGHNMYNDQKTICTNEGQDKQYVQ